MCRVPTEIVGAAHAYTRSEVPWSIPEARSGRGRMFDFISGGGMRTFGRTIRQEEVRRRQLRFLAASSAVIAIWLFLLFI